jgi:type II secretory ATPase GspE/PulE/Tfp pilus assembly ATPase PilB-like protein
MHPYYKGSSVRYRIDGVLKRITLLADGVGERVIRYFKARGNMDPTAHNIPQDGRMTLTMQGREYDLRISVLPVTGGESLVIRFLEQGRAYSLKHTGLSMSALQTIRRMLSNASGLILMTGPTGSGKSSTLYSMVAEINRVGINIITIENPVEYRVPGIAQVEVNAKAGLTFPAVIRSCMRQDPDVLLVGEIRDEETAEVALQAAVTGHMVLSTLHSNDAVTTVSRLVGLGIKPAVLSDALIGVIAQRLVRKLCKQCRVPFSDDSPNAEDTLFQSMTDISPSYQSVGCEACGYTGFSGRTPIIEIFEVTPPVKRLIADGNTSSEILNNEMWKNRTSRDESQGQNRTLAGSAARLIVSGKTTVREAVRVIGRDFWSGLAEEYQTKAPANPPILTEERDNRNAVLIVSSDTNLIQDLQRVFSENNMNSYTCQTPEEAVDLLYEHEEIFYFVGDLKDQPDEENLEFYHNARILLYWAYLPAILLLPDGHPQLKEQLVAAGVTSEMFIKPVNPALIYKHIHTYAIGNSV